MATITAKADSSWSSTSTWNGGVVPGNGDTADLNGHRVTMDIPTIPATGTLLALTGAGSNGILWLTTSGSGNYAINAATITGGSVGAGATIQIDGSGSGSLTINGNLVGSSDNNFTWLLALLAPSLTTVINGNLVGGTSSFSWAAYVSGAVVVVNGNVTGGQDCAAIILDSAVVTVNGNITGGTYCDNDECEGIVIYDGDTVVVVNGDVTAGTGDVSVDGNTCSGISNTAGSSVTVAGNIINNAHDSAIWGPFNYNPAPGNYTQYPVTGGGTINQYAGGGTVTITVE